MARLVLYITLYGSELKNYSPVYGTLDRARPIP
jgi:hypothetical protein